MNGIYDLTLRASKGEERRMAAFDPNEQGRHDLADKAHRPGLEIELASINHLKQNDR